VIDPYPAGESTLLELLTDAPPPDVAAAHEILVGCRSVVLSAGETLGWHRAEPLVVVEAGLVVVRAGEPARRQVIVADAGPGGLLCVSPHLASIQAISDATLLLIGPSQRDELLGIPAAAAAIASGLSSALIESYDVSSVMAAGSSRARVERKLILLARAYGRVVRDGIRLDVPLTHELLADMTGTARETVTRVLDILQREGFLRREGRLYRLQLEPEQLG